MHPDIPRFPLGSIDTHVHSRHSCDSRMDPSDAVKAARAASLQALVFTEHVDFDPADEGYGYYDSRAISSALDELRMTNSELRIYRGVEITYQQQHEHEIKEFIAEGLFDFVIGSVHMVGPDDLSRPEKQAAYYSSRTQREAYGAYFAEVEKLAASGLFDCLGHMDLCKRFGHQYYGPMAWQDFEPQITRILRSVINNNMYIELNTSGLRQDPKEPYPSLDVIREYVRLGGNKLTLGSDAHFPEHVGYAFPEVCGILNTE
jgi:histidinol-phosphatase (PHP family)